MKKSLALFSSLIILLSGCAQETFTPSFTDMQTAPRQEVFTAQDYEAEKTAVTNKASISAAVENIFSQNFADDVEVAAATKAATVTKNLQSKGGMIFSVLNKSKLAQKVGYLVSDIPVSAFFKRKGKPDSTPRINEKQISELKSVLKPGDIILNGNNSSFIHSILFMGNDTIIHSLATPGRNTKFLGTIRETLTEYLFRAERDKFIVLRYKNLDPNELNKVFDYANKQIGKSYDTLFLMNSDSRMYCTELVFQAVMQFTNQPKIYPHKVVLGWQLITNEDFMDSPDLETVWTLNKERPATGLLHKY